MYGIKYHNNIEDEDHDLNNTLLWYIVYCMFIQIERIQKDSTLVNG